MDAAFEKVKGLSVEERNVVLAMTVLRDRIQRLPEQDAEDLFQLFKCYTQAKTDEDMQAADEAIWEVLSREPASVRTMDLEAKDEDCAEFRKWKDFVAERVLQYRTEAGLTQEELAQKSSLPQSHISRIEKARLSPSDVTLSKIANALGIPVRNLDPNYPS